MFFASAFLKEGVLWRHLDAASLANKRIRDGTPRHHSQEVAMP